MAFCQGHLGNNPALKKSRLAIAPMPGVSFSACSGLLSGARAGAADLDADGLPVDRLARCLRVLPTSPTAHFGGRLLFSVPLLRLARALYEWRRIPVAGC